MQKTTKRLVIPSFNKIFAEYKKGLSRNNKKKRVVKVRGSANDKEIFEFFINKCFEYLLEHGKLRLGRFDLKICRRLYIGKDVEHDIKWDGNEYYMTWGNYGQVARNREYEFVGEGIDKLYEKVKDNWKRYE